MSGAQHRIEGGSVIELHVPDFAPIRDYYCGLGFEVAWEREPEDSKGYLVLKLDSNVLCFWAGNDCVYRQKYFKKFPPQTPRGYGVEIVIMINGILEFYRNMKDRANVVTELEVRPWGVQDFRAIDPAGFYLRFSEFYDVLDPQFAVA
jgi:hypothetical protein